jgi:hypothetical protein
LSRNAGYIVDCRQERGFVRLGRLVKAADFSHELQGRGADFVVSDGRIEVE